MKIAFVYDRVNKFGGAERVLMALHEIFPEAPLFTSVYNSKIALWSKIFPNVIPSFLQKFPLAKSNHEIYPLLMPIAFESLDFNGFDLVISITSEAGKGIITNPKTLHICYCLTPTRYLWSGHDEYFKNNLLKFLAEPIIKYLKRWDKVACRRPDIYIAISKTVQERIKKYYGLESKVIYPPINTDIFQSPTTNHQSPITNYYLVVSRLVKYKKVDLVIGVFNRLGWNLKIVGTGKEMGYLKKKAKENIEFLGQLTDEELLRYYQNCLAVIFPQEEDFGIVPLEAQACGKPVIAYRKGGATETVIERETGYFFGEQTMECLEQKLEELEETGGIKGIREKDCKKQAEKFSKERFKKEFKNCIEKEWKNHLKNTSMF